MKIAQSTLRKVIQEEIEKVREAMDPRAQIMAIAKDLVNNRMQKADAVEELMSMGKERGWAMGWVDNVLRNPGMYMETTVREAPTSDMGEMVDRASAQVDLLLARFMEYAETHPESALEMYEEINKLYKEYVEEERVDTDAEEQRDREINPDRYRYDDDDD